MRFLRTLDQTNQFRQHLRSLIKDSESLPRKAHRLLLTLELLFTVLFNIFDHEVFLGDLGVIDSSFATLNYPRSMKMYRLQNIFGALKVISEIARVVLEGKLEDKVEDELAFKTFLKSKLLLLLRNVLDIFVANYYLHKPKGDAAKTGVIGTISSLIGLAEAAKMI